MFNGVNVSLFVWCFMLTAKCIEVLDPEERANSLVRPVVFHGGTKRALSTTRHETGTHHENVIIAIAIEGEQYTMEMRLNRGLLTEGHTISYQEGGRTVQHKPTREEMDFCQYSGHVIGKSRSWVVLSTCRGFRGVICDGTKIRYIEPAEGNDIQSLHYVFEPNDRKTQFKCGYEHQPNDPDSNQLMKEANATRGVRNKREVSHPIPGGSNPNEKSRYVELVLVADHAQFVGAKRNLRDLHHQLQEITNLLNAIYSPLNIFIALTGVEVWTEGDKISIHPSSGEAIDEFMRYRRDTLLQYMRHDHAQLITGKKFLGGIIGKAYVSEMCTYQSSGAIIHRNPHTDPSATTAHTMSHEMGHNLGMPHDDADCECPVKQCVMYPGQTRYFSTHWSKCSLKALAVSFSKGLDYCLRNKPTSLFGPPSCGNGFIDPGEECDCGKTSEKTCTFQCCDLETCRLKPHAACATGSCCDLKSCQLKTPGTTCRAAQRECDLSEYCTGNSEFCPEDVFKMDTTPCSDKAYCMRGWCRSHNYQCHLLWGSTGTSSHNKCYEMNKANNEYHNCGYNLLTQQTQRCAPQDVKCGRLHCHRVNTTLEYSSLRARTQVASIFTDEEMTMCVTAVIDFGLDNVDPGLVPDGAWCGPGQMCFKQQCLPMAAVRERAVPHPSQACLAGCSGHGVCNSKGHCHCDDGFGPPLCDLPGPGGSVESGPSTDARVQECFKIVAYIIFLGIVPLVFLIILLIFLIKRKSLRERKQNYQSTSSTATSVTKIIDTLLVKNKEMLNQNIKPESVQRITKDDIKIITDATSSIIPRRTSNINANTRVKLESNKEDIKRDTDIQILSSTIPVPMYSNVEQDVATNNNKTYVAVVKIQPKQLLLTIDKFKSDRVTIDVPSKNDNILDDTIMEHKADTIDEKANPIAEDKLIANSKSTKSFVKIDHEARKEVTSVVSTKTLKPMLKRKPVLNISKNIDELKPDTSGAIKIGMNKHTNDMPNVGIDVKAMKGIYENHLHH